MNNGNYSDMYVNDEETLSVDYTRTLATAAPGVTVVSGTWSVTRYGGTADPDPSAILVDGTAGVVAGNIVSIRVKPLIAGVLYWPRCRAILSDGQEITLPDPGKGSLRIAE